MYSKQALQDSYMNFFEKPSLWMLYLYRTQDFLTRANVITQGIHLQYSVSGTETHLQGSNRITKD